MNQGELNDPFTYIFQSAYILFKKAFVYDALLNPYPYHASPLIFIFSMAFFKALIIAPVIILTFRIDKTRTGTAAACNTFRRDGLDFISFGAWIAAGMLISPNGSSYSLILLLIPWLGLAQSRLDGSLHPGPAGSVISGLFLLAACSVPVQRFGGLPLLAQFPRLYLLLIFFGLVILKYGKLQASGYKQDFLQDAGLPQGLAIRSNRYMTLALFVFLCLLFESLELIRLPHPRDPSSYLLVKEEHLYIHDFGVRDRRLAYTYMDPAGLHQVLTDIPARSATDSGLRVENNQILYLGRRMTNSADRKEQPLLINGNTILYLSDKGRGVGFYTLRKITLAGD
jgi:hypothetical protein